MRSFKKRLLSLVNRMFGAPKGRHVVEASPPALSAPMAPSTPVVVDPGAQLEPVPPVAPSVVAAEPVTPVAMAYRASLRTAPAELATIRLIFADGSVVPLPEGTLEGRRAHYLARRVLEAGRHP